MADLIVLAGIVALESTNSALELPFCGGYVDTDDGAGSVGLEPRIYQDPFVTVTDDFLVKGLTQEQGVAWASAEHVGSQWYKDLLAGSRAFDTLELALLEGELRPIVETFAKDEAALLKTFTEAWTYMMTADRFESNMGNVCTGVALPTTTTSTSPAVEVEIAKSTTAQKKATPRKSATVVSCIGQGHACSGKDKCCSGSVCSADGFCVSKY